ncbi:GNAT family N-acetyltransferase [Erythrobacter sp. SDW2]|uniref:GNAT family N-acetyltransferase n=1 Tax=Erythrobacter sp. SDW2 TaxID=2907154 RepID=UPI001F1BFEA7|nr:GNAT family N-acetyltransferase [Erythrobacter sp. SDW2]UIP07398.1 GNAT family N-acetyltransferase [Erythrobacter sp. SDW2]
MSGPFLVTERLELRQPVRDDLHPLFEIIAEPETRRYLGPEPAMPDHFMRFTRNAGSWTLYGYGTLMVRERGGDGTLLGNCGIFHSWRGLGEDFDDKPEAGWILRESAVGKGYAGEIMRAVLAWWDAEFAAELVCLIDPTNVPSLKLAAKLGFAPMRDGQMPDGSVVKLLRRVPPR